MYVAYMHHMLQQMFSTTATTAATATATVTTMARGISTRVKSGYSTTLRLSEESSAQIFFGVVSRYRR